MASSDASRILHNIFQFLTECTFHYRVFKVFVDFEKSTLFGVLFYERLLVTSIDQQFSYFLNKEKFINYVTFTKDHIL